MASKPEHPCPSNVADMRRHAQDTRALEAARGSELDVPPENRSRGTDSTRRKQIPENRSQDPSLGPS
eukprot:2084633-Pyramimonas_sp.AAC.1